MNTLYWSKVREDAIIPTRNDENGGYDIYANFEAESVIIQSGEIAMIPTGIASAFDKLYVGLFEERGSTGIRGMSKRAGVIDSGFRNEWIVVLNNTTNKPIVITKDKNYYDDNCTIYPYDKAIAQVVFVPIAQFEEIQTIPYEELLGIKSERGLGMLGASGK